MKAEPSQDRFGHPRQPLHIGLIYLTAILVIVAYGCSFFKVRPASAPAGPAFPLVRAEAFFYDGRIVPPAAAGNGRVVFVTSRGYVYALDAGRRVVVWVYRAPQPVSRPVSLGAERVYVLDDLNMLHCLDLTGRLLWTKTIAEGTAGPLNEVGGLLCLGTEQGSLIALQPKDGSEAWRFQAGAAVRTGALSWTDGRGTSFILCGGDEGNLYFLSLDGRRRGHMACGSKLVIPPLLDKDRLYLGTEDQQLLCLDLAKRSIKWGVRLTGRPATSPLADARRVFFLTAQGVLMCLDKKSGSVLWWKTISSRSGFNPVLAGEQVVVTSLSERLVSFNARDGQEVGNHMAEREVRSNPLWVPPHLLVHVSDRQREGEILLFLKKEKDDGTR